MACVRHGLELPLSSSVPKLLHLWTTGGVIIVLFVSLIAMMIVALQGSPRYFSGYLYIIVPFLVIMVVLCIVFLKDITAYRERKRIKR